jgi:hypothetical protein
MVDYLKHRGWIVHGVRRLEQAFPILQQIEGIDSVFMELEQN